MVWGLRIAPERKHETLRPIDARSEIRPSHASGSGMRSTQRKLYKPSDDLAAHRDRYTAPHHDEASRGRGGGGLSIDGVLKPPARPPQESRPSGVAWRAFNAPRHGPSVRAAQEN